MRRAQWASKAMSPHPINHGKQSELYHSAMDSTHLREEGVRGIVNGE